MEIKIEEIQDMQSFLEEIQDMQSFLETQCGEHPQEIIDKILVLEAYSARTSKMLPLAKREQERAVERESENVNITLPPSAINIYIKSKCSNENYIVNWLDRMNRTITHQLDATRSILSYEKEQLKNL